jgi:hypothetical protein
MKTLKQRSSKNQIKLRKEWIYNKVQRSRNNKKWNKKMKKRVNWLKDRNMKWLIKRQDTNSRSKGSLEWYNRL